MTRTSRITLPDGAKIRTHRGAYRRIGGQRFPQALAEGCDRKHLVAQLFREMEAEGTFQRSVLEYRGLQETSEGALAPRLPRDLSPNFLPDRIILPIASLFFGWHISIPSRGWWLVPIFWVIPRQGQGPV
jgi:hypothetical protein